MRCRTELEVVLPSSLNAYNGYRKEASDSFGKKALVFLFGGAKASIGTADENSRTASMQKSIEVAKRGLQGIALVSACLVLAVPGFAARGAVKFMDEKPIFETRGESIDHFARSYTNLAKRIFSLVDARLYVKKSSANNYKNMSPYEILISESKRAVSGKKVWLAM